jgi:hypothetical protein
MMSENKIRGMQLNSRWCSVLERMKRIKTEQNKSPGGSLNEITPTKS